MVPRLRGVGGDVGADGKGVGDGAAERVAMACVVERQTFHLARQ